MILELQNTVLEMIATGAPLKDTIDKLCLKAETMVTATVCSVLSVRCGRLRPLAGPSLPDDYSAALDNLPIGPLAGSCGTAAYERGPVEVTDIDHDLRWADYKDLVRPLGFKACWSTPIFSGDRVVATFAFYYRENRGPSELDQQIVDACVHLCSIAIEREERISERERLTYVDPLTGLKNRAKFNLNLTELSTNSPRSWGLLLLDIDNLKPVNDTFGHRSGDDLIVFVARTIEAIMGVDQTFRIGGDEFAVIIESAEASSLAREAERILESIKLPTRCGGHVILPSVSIGGAVSELTEGTSDVRQCADVALYHAKERNRGQYIGYAPGLGTAITERFRAIRDVGLALAEDRIDAFYQPIVRLDTREVVGFEALCRMKSMSGEIISAANFHEATKDANVASDLTQRMLCVVAADIRKWLDLGLPVQHVGINLAAADFHAGGLQTRLSEVFLAAGVPLKHIILEVTESVYLGQRDYVVAEEIRALRASGMRVALDDFGTGFASLTHLLTVPIDIIKIDRSFIERLVPGDAASIIVEGIMNIARKLGLRVVAEGIETDDQLSQLLGFGCQLGQGYLFSRAVERAEATTMLSNFGQRNARKQTQSRSAHSA